MVEIFPYEKRYWYPHLKPNDIAIWERFIDRFPNAFKSVQYDFSVGEIPIFVQQAPQEEQASMAELYRLKIDVLGFTDDHIALIELKQDAGASSIGQVTSYLELYRREVANTLPVRPYIITNTLKPNMAILTEAAGVKLYVV